MAEEDERAHHHDWAGPNDVVIGVVVRTTSKRQSTLVASSWCSGKALREGF